MARTHETATVTDSDIYMSIDGYIGVMPFPNPTALSDEERAVAIAEGCKQIALRKAQTAARNAAKANGDVRAAVNTFLASFKPSTDTEFQTVGSKRAELARGLLKQLLVKNNKASDDATVEKNLGAFLASEKHAPNIQAAVDAWLASYTPPTKRGAKEANGSAGVDLASDIDDLDS
jgi:hypothetical protein